VLWAGLMSWVSRTDGGGGRGAFLGVVQMCCLLVTIDLCIARELIFTMEVYHGSATFLKLNIRKKEMNVRKGTEADFHSERM